jgi:hypothetical protein
MTNLAPLPFEPVAVALESIKFDKRSDDVKFCGVDLESGRRVQIKIRFIDDDRTSTDPISDLVVLLSLERVTL